MVNIRTETNYNISCCHCSDSIKISKFERNVDGWEISSNTFPISIGTITDIKCPACIKKEHFTLFNSAKMSDRVKSKYYDDSEADFYDDICEEIGLKKDHPKRKVFVQLVFDYSESSWLNRYHYAIELSGLI